MAAKKTAATLFFLAFVPSFLFLLELKSYGLIGVLSLVCLLFTKLMLSFSRKSDTAAF